MSDVRVPLPTTGQASASSRGPQPDHERPRGAPRGRHSNPTAFTEAAATVRAAATGRIARWVGPVLVLAAGAVLRIGALPHQTTPGLSETALVTQVVDVTRWIMTGTPGSPISASAVQLAALGAAIGSWGWSASVLDAVRNTGLPLWLIASAQLWLVARRLGATRGTAVVAIAVLALAPTAVRASVHAAPENVAAVWVLAAVLLVVWRTDPLADPEHDRPWIGPLVGVSLGFAVITTPLALALAPTVVLPLARRADSWRAVATCALGFAAVLAGAATLGAGPASAPATWFPPGWLVADPVTPVLGLVVGLGALTAPRWREFAFGLVAISALGWTRGAPASALILPLAVALAAAVLTERRAPGPTHWAGGPGFWAGPVVGAIALTWAIHPQSPPWTTPPVPVAARGWLAGNLPPDQPLRADGPARVSVATGLADWSRFATEADCHAHWWPGCSSAWWIGTATRTDGGTLVARFGPADQPGGLAVRTGQPQPADPIAELRARQVAGGVLASSPRLVLTAELAAQLRAGLLDPRACTALGALVSNQRIRLLALAPVPGDTTATLRQLSIAPDGPAPNGADTPDAELRSISAFFLAQLAPFRPFAMAVTPASVEVRYSPYTPPGLLTAFLPPT